MVYDVEMEFNQVRTRKNLSNYTNLELQDELDLLITEISRWQVVAVTVAVSFYILFSRLPGTEDYFTRFFVPRFLRIFIKPCSKYAVYFGGLQSFWTVQWILISCSFKFTNLITWLSARQEVDPAIYFIRLVRL
ncbi:hypothetical protein SADUNF_Sadunf15G0104800 [Salix dunnii]|uniref:Uncharacterized protein n=1 Tax=Salix dunnii TaxID=1413687 RepID=A0A835JDJ9_9ROSI|nr:hypothetical protein SADUNF_Sadunf15G0104800 [Salix dunnii]